MFNETLVLLDSIGSYMDVGEISIITGNSYGNILQKASEFYFGERTGGYISFDIGIVVYANSEEEAKNIIKTHPIYLQDVQDTIDAFYYDNNKGQTKIREMDVIDYIFGDTGQKLAQLCGDFAEVPVEYHHIFR